MIWAPPILRSIRFNVILVALIAATSALGTVLPQIPESPQKVDEFLGAHPLWGRFLWALGLFNLYHSWWFMGLLGLMAYDIIICKLWNKPPDADARTLPPEMGALAKPYQAELSTRLSPAAALAGAREFLAGRGYRPLSETGAGEGRRLLRLSRHRLQRWGSYVAHVSLVVILVGALVKGVFGFEEMLPILQGRSRAMERRPWEVHVDEFAIRYYPGTLNPSEFASSLRVTRGDKELASKRIVVNDPLSLGLVRFYQASWGAGGMFRTATLQLGRSRIEVPQRKPMRIPGTSVRVEADVLMPNFTVAKGNRPDTESLDLKNPAVRFKFSMGGRNTAPLWLFVNWPELCFVEDENGVLHHGAPPPFRLAAVDPVLFSGIQAGYDPGFPVVLAGSLGWLGGMMGLFYLHRREFWILAERGRVVVGAWSSRGPREFGPEFHRIVKDLSRKLEATPKGPALMEV